MTFIDDAITDRALGFSLHYPTLRAAVIGLHAQRTFEFGAGGSTRVFLDALGETGGHHTSISTDPSGDIAARHWITSTDGWAHTHGRSENHREMDAVGPFDLVLHDGSHAAGVVASDVAWIWPRLRRYGLLLVHDTLHSYVGAEVRAGLALGLVGASFSATTLPYGFGLTIVLCEEPGAEPITTAVAKVGSEHRTDLLGFPLRGAA